MALEAKTKAKVLSFFGNKICSRCGAAAERYVSRQTYCQRCYLVLNLKIREKEPTIRELHDPLFEENC